MSLAFATNAGGIDKSEAPSIVLDNLINRVARGARNRRNDGAIGSRQTVQQSRLPDIRMADDRHLGFVTGSGSIGRFIIRLRCFVLGFLSVPLWSTTFLRWQDLKDRIQQIVDASAVFGGDWNICLIPRRWNSSTM